MARPRSYSDTELARAVGASRSWRGVLRNLGLSATSSSAIRSVRRHAEELGLDHSHFSGQRKWTHRQLRSAIAHADSWDDVVAALGLQDPASQVTLRGHAIRLGVDTTHLEPRPPRASISHLSTSPETANLSRSGTLLAAAWFALCGHEVSWPLEPARYDLLVKMGEVQRVQVKTTTVRAGRSWTAWLSTTGKSRRPYDPEEIDYFFVIDGDFDHYLIPSSVVGGLHAVTLSSYGDYRVSARPGQLLG